MWIFHMVMVWFAKVWILILLKRVNVFLLFVVQTFVTQRLGNRDLAVHERVPFQLLQGWSIVRTFYENSSYETTGIVRNLQLLRKCIFAVADFTIRHLDIIILERRLSINKYENDDSEGPHVHLERVAIVHLTVDYLRSQVVRRSADGVSTLRLGLDLLSEPKIAYFYLHFVVDE